MLTGRVDPSGRLPITFPNAIEQLPRPTIPSFGTPENTAVTVAMTEGADVGYRWFARRQLTPMYAFGHGLSSTSFAYSGLALKGGKTPGARFMVRNTGSREGADVPQLYLRSIDNIVNVRLLGFERVSLKPGESRMVTLNVDPRLLANYDAKAHRWRIKAASYEIALSSSASASIASRRITLGSKQFAD